MKRWQRGLMIALTSLLVLCLLMTGGGLLGFRLLFPRWDPDPALPSPTAPAPVEITFPSGENRLSGWVWEAEAPAGLVVFCHGYRSTGRDHLAEALWFLDRGWTVLLYDGTGVGESGGAAVRGFDQFRLDLLAALDYVETSPWGDLPTVLYGHSAGAWAAATVLKDRPRIRGAVLVSGFDTPVELMYATAAQGLGVLALAGYPSLWAAEGLLFGQASNRSAVESINESGVPVLIVRGTEDTVVPQGTSLYDHREELTGAVAWLTVDEAGRNGHSGLWLSPAGAAYRASLAETDLTAADPARLYELDPHFMLVLDLFYRKSVSSR